MKSKTHKFTRKTAVALVLITALVLLAFVLLRWNSEKASEFTTSEERQKFLSSLGWEVDLSSEAEKAVIIPDKFEGVMEDYNNMQQEQGLDLSKYSGQRCIQYTYNLLNYPGVKENIYLTIYVKDDVLIAGDIHTNSVNGFMQGIMPTEQNQ